MTSKTKILIGLGAFGLLAAAIALGAYFGQHVSLPPSPESTTASPSPTLSTPEPVTSLPPDTTASPTPSPTPVATLPDSFKISDVPFIPQAPHKNWDAIHEETCEEAAVLTVVHYLEGKRQPDVDEIETELQNLIAWEQRVLGIYEDTNAAETARILSEYFDYGNRVRVIPLASLDDIKREIVAGRPVIVPAAGRLLGNRHFKVPGPVYHMVVVIGFEGDEIITHDPGTQFGANYRYGADQFWQAIHDFVDRTDEGMATGAKVGLVVDAAASAD